MAAKKIVRTASGLRDALFDQMDNLNAGTVAANEARAFAALSGNIIKSVEMQLKYEAMRIAGTAPALGQMKLVGHEPKA